MLIVEALTWLCGQSVGKALMHYANAASLRPPESQDMSFRANGIAPLRRRAI